VEKEEASGYLTKAGSGILDQLDAPGSSPSTAAVVAFGFGASGAFSAE
jgi:hypothetical protein